MLDPTLEKSKNKSKFKRRSGGTWEKKRIQSEYI